MAGRPRVDVKVRTVSRDPGAFTSQAAAALRALRAFDAEPLLLAYHPVAHLNPFQGLLYQQLWPAGIAPIAMPAIEQLDELEMFAKMGRATVLHLHWLNVVLMNAATAEAAHAAGAAFLARLDQYLAAGGHLMWSVHNILPHDAVFDDQEAWLRGEVAARADIVHILAANTVELVAPHFTIPADRVLSVPHPSYIGAYEDLVSREQARHLLGIMPDEQVFVTLGAIKPYKGLDRLVDAWEAISPDGAPRRLLIAGRVGVEDAMDPVLDRAALHHSILLHAESVLPSDVPIFLRAADVAVLPYVRTLNSGAQMLALTFGLPSIVPASTGLAAVGDPRCTWTFDPDVEGDLAAVLRRAGELISPEARAAAFASAQALAPAVLSARFASGVRAAIDAKLRSVSAV
jgi:beta-1,4-mannosyltransferase